MKRLREPISSVTHLIGGGLSVIALVSMIIKQVIGGSLNYSLFISTLIFGTSLILTYFTSGIYHAIDEAKKKTIEIARKIDHSMIYILIAGSYSPFCLYVLPYRVGIPVFKILWILAIAGIVLKVSWMKMPRVLSAMLYILMGWTAIFVIKDLYRALAPGAFFLLTLGGVLYTIGGIIYAVKKPNLKKWNFHDIFHIFIMLGSLAHFLLVFVYLI